MSPLLEDGDYALMRRISRRSTIKVGDIVLIAHPKFGDIIKRIGVVTADGYVAEGIAAQSVSAAEIGTVGRDDVLAKLVWRVSPRGVRRVPV